MAAGLYDITNEILGKGHFAIVKLAKHCLTGEHVAIKVIDKAKLNKEGLEQLSHEIRLWSILSEHEHPNVVKLYQCIDTRTKLYLVMEYCGGQVCDLYDHIQKKNDGNGLNEHDAKQIFRQVCNAILYCHSLKIVHRDLKPENILIISTPNGKNSESNLNIYPLVKLIDFGFSNQYAEDELLRTSCGSLAYSAPEILLGNQYDGPKVDIWALGCILYILLYGCNPFMQANDNETLIKILDCSFATPEKSSFSKSAINLIRGLLRKDPNTRLSIEEVIGDEWLENDEFKSSDSVNRGVPKLHVNEHIIDQMIDQGIALPKDTIKKILKNEHSDDEEVKDETVGNKMNDHHYVKATYHLLKDKSLRECKGLDHNSNLNYNKRGNILKKPNYTNSKKMNLNQDKSGNLSVNTNNRLLKPNLCSLEVPQNSNSFALPLARKCSIVSEEGSVTAEATSSTIQPQEKILVEKLSEQPEISHPIVDIFVTESSDNLHKVQTNVSESISDFSLSKSNANKFANKKGPEKLSHNDSGLHPVSSSPDFLNSETLKADEERQTLQNREEKICDLNRLPNEYKSKEDFDISAYNKDSLFNRYRDYPKPNNKKLNNVRVAKSSTNASANASYQSNKSPSMRVIIQSKSLNNIAIAEQSEAKLATSMSTASMKPPKSEKTDCCTVS